MANCYHAPIGDEFFGGFPVNKEPWRHPGALRPWVTEMFAYLCKHATGQEWTGFLTAAMRCATIEGDRNCIIMLGSCGGATNPECTQDHRQLTHTEWPEYGDDDVLSCEGRDDPPEPPEFHDTTYTDKMAAYRGGMNLQVEPESAASSELHIRSCTALLTSLGDDAAIDTSATTKMVSRNHAVYPLLLAMPEAEAEEAPIAGCDVHPTCLCDISLGGGGAEIGVVSAPQRDVELSTHQTPLDSLGSTIGQAVVFFTPAKDAEEGKAEGSEQWYAAKKALIESWTAAHSLWQAQRTSLPSDGPDEAMDDVSMGCGGGDASTADMSLDRLGSTAGQAVVYVTPAKDAEEENVEGSEKWYVAKKILIDSWTAAHSLWQAQRTPLPPDGQDEATENVSMGSGGGDEWTVDMLLLSTADGSGEYGAGVAFGGDSLALWNVEAEQFPTGAGDGGVDRSAAGGDESTVDMPLLSTADGSGAYGADAAFGGDPSALWNVEAEQFPTGAGDGGVDRSAADGDESIVDMPLLSTADGSGGYGADAAFGGDPLALWDVSAEQLPTGAGDGGADSSAKGGEMDDMIDRELQSIFGEGAGQGEGDSWLDSAAFWHVSLPTGASGGDDDATLPTDASGSGGNDTLPTDAESDGGYYTAPRNAGGDDVDEMWDDL